MVLAGEVVLLAGVAAGWAATGGQPGAGTASLLLVLASAAMGVQSAVTISSGVRGASTTHLTGTFTEAVDRGGRSGPPAQRVGSFVGFGFAG